jgi:DNA-binding MarR family transcriptional regulator
MATSPALEQIHHAIDHFWENFPPVWHRIRSHVRSIVDEKSEISVEQFHILRHIRIGITTVSDLAVEKQTSRSAVSQAVDGLVLKGFITRQENPADRRFVQLALTSQGAELLQTIFLQNREWMLEKLAVLTSEELDQVSQGMIALKKAFDEA